MRRVRVLLAMPTLAPVTVQVTPEDGAAAVSPKRLTFTPENWRRPQTLEVRGSAKGRRLRLRIPEFELDETVDIADLDPLRGARAAFRTIP